MLKAFSELDSDRGYIDIKRQKLIDGKAREEIIKRPLPIPFNSIVQYARIYKYEEDFEEFLYLLRAVDNIYIELILGIK